MGKPTSGGAGGSGGRQRAVPPPLVVAPPARNITITGQAGIEKLQRVFGRQLSSDEVGDMIGAPDGSRITVTSGGGSTFFEVKHPHVKKMKSKINTINGILMLYNDSIVLNKKAPPGSGTQIINRQVEAARQLGIKNIGLFAAGSKKSTTYNGYYTWTRLGFDGNTPTSMVSRIPAEIKSTMRDNTMLELYRTQAGRDWWRANGSGVRVGFDTSPNSKSSQALDAYNEERRNRSG